MLSLHDLQIGEYLLVHCRTIIYIFLAYFIICVVCPISACMFLEDSSVGREVLKEECTALLSRVAKMIPVVMSDEAAQNGLLCYQTVKVKTQFVLKFDFKFRMLISRLLLLSQLCLQIFQLLPGQVAPLICSKEDVNMSVRDILEFLMNIVLGEVGACGHIYIFVYCIVSVCDPQLIVSFNVFPRFPAETHGCWQALRLLWRLPQ